MTSCVQPNCFDSKDDQFLPLVPTHAWSVTDNLPSTFHGQLVSHSLPLASYDQMNASSD